jgi:hypothetical protein
MKTIEKTRGSIYDSFLLATIQNADSVMIAARKDHKET